MKVEIENNRNKSNLKMLNFFSTIKYQLALIILFFFSCQPKSNHPSDPTTALIDTSLKVTPSAQIVIKENNNEENEEFKDSIRLAKILTEVIELAEKNKFKDNFELNFEKLAFDSMYNVVVELKMNNFFEKDKKHLIIKRQNPGETFINVYVLDNQKFHSVINHRTLTMGFLGSELKDINGDYYNDYLIHCYPSAGCCLRNVYHTYIYKPENQNFTSEIAFINPTFSPKEKVIRGLEYGHPGEARMYKFKWKGFKIDTIEFIDHSEEGKYIKILPSGKVIKMDNIPTEYRKIERYDWFGGE